MDTERLIIDNVGLVYKQLHRFNLAYNDDAFSFAMEALMSAARTYDISKGIQFSTYATTCIYNAVCKYLRIINKKRQLTLVSYEDIEYQQLPNIFDTPEEVYIKQETQQVAMSTFNRLVDNMPKSSKKEVLCAWHNSDFTATQSDLAEITGLSQSYISRVLTEFKYKLKNELKELL